jgi:carboxypeptidase family protein
MPREVRNRTRSVGRATRVQLGCTVILVTAAVGSTACRQSSKADSAIVTVAACDTVSRMRIASPARIPDVGSAADGSGTVVGTVRDRETGAALPGALVQVEGVRERSAKTDTAGGFVLEGLVPGARMLRATRIGYDVARDSVQLTGGRVDTLEVRLQYRACP